MESSIQQLKLICSQSSPVLLPFIFFLFFLYKWLHTKSSTTKKNLPPSPPKLPILGNLHQIGVYPHRSLHSLAIKHGDLMLVQFGTIPALVVSSMKAAREIMKTHDAVFSSRPQLKTVNKLFYSGKDIAVAPYGEYWRQMKSICVLQLLNNKKVRSFRSAREEEMHLLMEKIQESMSSPVDISEMFITLTNDVICRVAFGRKYSGKEGMKVLKLFKEFQEMLGRFRVGDFIPWLAWTTRVDGSIAKVDKIANEFDQFLEGVVKEHEDRLGDHKMGEDHAPSDAKSKDFVDVLLDVQTDTTSGFQIERESIKAILLDIFSGGTDTSYTVLEWTMTELLRHPKVMHELQNEVRGIANGKTYVDEDDLEKMKYLKAVMKETLRLHPPIPMLAPRLSTQDAKVNGYDIPAGTLVFANAWAIHRDPASWEEPEKFYPDRFLKSSTDFKGQDFQLIPFGAGRRMCPGISFAMTNNELVIANLMHKFNWSLPGGAKGETLDTTEFIGLTTHRKTPLVVVATNL